MRVLLISANTETINMPVLPLGMACVAAAARKAGHTVQTVNLMMQKDVRTPIARAVGAFSPEVIGISVRNIDDQSMRNPVFLLDAVVGVVAACRSHSTVPIVLGGAGYSIFPKSALEYLGADMGIQGEGEAAFVQLLDALERKAVLSDIPGLFLPGTGHSKSPAFPRSLDIFPIPKPDIHLIPPSGIDADQLWIPFQTRRGCAMACSYCSTATIEGRILRKYSPRTAVEGLRRFTDAGFHQFFFVDNTFNLPPSYAADLCNAIIAARLDIRWRCIFYPWKADDRLIEKMASAGCREVSLGFESGAESILKNLNKRFSPREVTRISGMLKKHGIRRMGFLLLGGPGETMETATLSLEFADSLQLEAMKITTGIRIYPYTALARMAVADGMISSENELIRPRFYMVPGLKDRLLETVGIWMKDRRNWHG